MAPDLVSMIIFSHENTWNKKLCFQIWTEDIQSVLSHYLVFMFKFETKSSPNNHHLFSVPPTLLGSDDVRTVTVPVNGHLTLECLADSDPAPNIEWYKDETKLQVHRKQKETNTNV